MTHRSKLAGVAVVLAAGVLVGGQAAEEGFRPLFNGRDLNMNLYARPRAHQALSSPGLPAAG